MGIIIKASQFKRKLFSSSLHLLMSIYGLLYLMFIIPSFFPSTIGLVSDSSNPYDLENLSVKLLFLLFLAGFFTSWKNEGVAGLIFALWWVGVWIQGKFIIAPLYGHGSEGLAMGLPLLILAVMFILSWNMKRGVNRALLLQKKQVAN